MPLSSTSRPAIRGRIVTRLPASFTATGGLAVSKANGRWTFEPDWTTLETETTIPDPDARLLWIYDSSAGSYKTLTLEALIDELPDGPQGPPAGFRQAYSTTTTDSDPGAGVFQLNNATPASATEGYFDNVDADGVSLTTVLDRMDDKGNSSGRGILRMEKETDTAVWAEWLVTGSVVDGTGYRKLTLSGGTGSGAFTAADVFRIAFTPQGTDGAIGGSVGTTANGGVRASGTGGATLKAGLYGNDDSGNLYPLTNDTGALGTSSLKWADLFLADGAVINFNAGSMTITHSSGVLTFAGGVTKHPNTGFGIFDTNASHVLKIVPGSDITADRSLTITTGDADRTLTLSANATLTGSPIEQGRHTIWVPAAAMYTRTTNGAAAGTAEMATNKNIFKTFDFDTSTQEFVQFEVFFPKSWNLGTVTFQPVLSHASGSGNVVFGLAGVARSNDDAGDVAFGTAQTSDTTVGTANDIYIGPESSAITIAGTPEAGDTVQFQVNRTVASDNLGVDARLHGVRLFYTINAATDT